MAVPKRKKRKDPAAVKLGRKGGLKGGRARMAALTPEQRAEFARLGGLAKAASAKKRHPPEESP